MRFVEPLIVDEPEEEIPDQVGDDGQEPVVIPAVEPEPPVSLDEVPDIPGGLFEEPTLF